MRVKRLDKKLKLQALTLLSRLAYQHIQVGMIRTDDKYRYKWEVISDKTWNQHLNNVSKLTLSTKLRSFQYRLINFALTTNRELYRWKMKALPLCYFCGKYEETYTHIFMQCELVQKRIWRPLSRWLDYYCNITLDIDAYEYIFSVYKDVFSSMVNTIILIVKQYLCHQMPK